MKVTFKSPFDAWAFAAKLKEQTRQGDDDFQGIHCRPCRTRNEQDKYIRMKSQLNKLNQDARARGCDSESYSLRNSGHIWKFLKNDSGKWLRVSEWTYDPPQEERQPQSEPESSVNPNSGNEPERSRP